MWRGGHTHVCYNQFTLRQRTQAIARCERAVAGQTGGEKKEEWQTYAEYFKAAISTFAALSWVPDMLQAVHLISWPNPNHPAHLA